MANPWAGEVALVMDGERHVLKLTLGALAELEDGLNTGGLVELVERLPAGKKPRTCGGLICALWRGLKTGFNQKEAWRCRLRTEEIC